MDGATNAVLVLRVQFWHLESIEGLGLDDVSLGGGINNVSDGESLDSLVLGDLSGTVSAGDGFDSSSIGFGSTSVSSLSGHVANIIIY